MNTEHIINILEAGSLDRLSPGDREAIEQHVEDCAACARAYQAARLAAELLHSRMTDVLEPSPFFKTRVMAAVRAQKAESSFSFANLWRTGRAMLASIVMVVAILLGVNFYVGGFGSQTGSEDPLASDNIYSTEWVLLENGASNVTDSEALTTLYESPSDYEQDN
jgi:anti-sigma factor RsiW